MLKSEVTPYVAYQLGTISEDGDRGIPQIPWPSMYFFPKILTQHFKLNFESFLILISVWGNILVCQFKDVFILITFCVHLKVFEKYLFCNA